MRERSAIFWDFDGVIKESVAVKTHAYMGLFREHGPKIMDRVRVHHEENSGQSRLDKIPLYLSWVYEEVSEELVERYCHEFKSIVVDAVIGSDWVPGAREYLEKNFSRQRFVMVTATPQAEIEIILKALGLDRFFEQVYGAPIPKDKAIKMVLDDRFFGISDCLMVGDSSSDLEAAGANGLDFLLRVTSINGNLQATHSGRFCKDFSDE